VLSQVYIFFHGYYKAGVSTNQKLPQRRVRTGFLAEVNGDGVPDFRLPYQFLIVSYFKYLREILGT
jgi:hypothetical protein